jgi:hypothetical protein
MTEVWASSPPAKHCRDPGTFDADEALAMSLGLSARGNRTRPLAVKAKYRTSSPRIACTPGNIRDGFTPCGESHALPLSYGRARAPPGGFEPPTLRLPMQPISSPPENRFRPRVARGRRKSLGNRRFRRFPDRNAEPFSRSARNPRRTGPRGADSTARSNGGGIRTRIAIVAKYPKSSPPASGRCLEDVRSRVAAGVPGERSSLVGPRAFVWSRSNETRHHPGGFSFRGKGRTSTAPKGLRFQTKERGSSPPGTISHASAAWASGGTAEFRWPEGLRHSTK